MLNGFQTFLFMSYQFKLYLVQYLYLIQLQPTICIYVKLNIEKIQQLIHVAKMMQKIQLILQ